MDLGALADQVQDAGLAQTIQAGLQKNLMKKANFGDQAQLTAKMESTGPEILDTTLGKHCLEHFSKSGPADTGFESFKQSPEFSVLCKHLCLKDNNSKLEVTEGLFYETRPLGRGAFGCVFLVFRLDTGAPFAVKKMMKPIIKKQNMVKDALIEREVLEKVNSRFLVNLHYAWQTPEWVGLVLTLCAGGDLSFQIQQQYPKDKDGKKEHGSKYKGFSTAVLKFYAASMAIGLSQIHEAGFVYRDMKPQNVLLDLDGQVRISDMGLTADVSGGPIKQCSGTRGYWSPETIKKEPYTFQPDWFSLGCTIFVLFSDKLPFHGKTHEESDAKTLNGDLDYKHGEPADLQSLISALCEKDPAKRAGLKEMKEHAYFSGFDWDALASGKMKATLVPNPDEINAPSSKDVEGFVAPKDVKWEDDDQAKLKTWTYFNKAIWDDECILFMDKMKALDGGGGGGGGGCCTLQ